MLFVSNLVTHKPRRDLKLSTLNTVPYYYRYCPLTCHELVNTADVHGDGSIMKFPKTYELGLRKKGVETVVLCASCDFHTVYWGECVYPVVFPPSDHDLSFKMATCALLVDP